MADLETQDQGVGTQEDFDLWEEELGESAPSTLAGGEDPEKLEHQRNNSEKAKISLPETVIFTMLALFMDSLEFLGGLANVLPVIGPAIWFIIWVMGLFVSAIILLWTFIRGAHGRRAVKIGLGRLLGFLADAFIFVGWLPIRTLVLVITIWINNHLENKNVNRLTSLLEKI